MASETPTATLRRISPFWAGVRANVTLQVAGGALIALVTVVGGWASLKSDVATVQRDVAKLAEIITHQPDDRPEIAALKQQVADLQAQVNAQSQKWERVEQYADMRVKKR